MLSTLVIVESPAKAKTISKFLGRKYRVKASMGHVRDLPKSEMGVDVQAGFEPRYITIRGKGKVLQELRSEARKSDRVFLATDPDREGEAISWHLAQELGLEEGTPCRIEFHEITKGAVQRAIERPRTIDHNRVDAQQARRILDRLVGYRLSPLLWEKVKRGLSAGRVQSVAVRLIVDREREIEAFVPREYWTVTALLAPQEDPDNRFTAELARRGEQKVEIGSAQEAAAIVEALKGASFSVASVSRKERRRSAPPPFTTSTLQQEASRRLGFPARKTMSIAQQLYEGIEVGSEGSVGLITYMRTDAVRVAAEAQQEARQLIRDRFGSEFVPEKPPIYRSKKGAQEAHEAIRPTSVQRTPESLKPFLKRDQLRLYALIWRRFVASQMAAAVYDTVSVEILAREDIGPGLSARPLRTADLTAEAYLFRASGSTLRFPGFLAVWEIAPSDSERASARAEKPDAEGREPGEGEGADQEPERTLPALTEGQPLVRQGLEPQQHFTQPPPRYSEALLVKTLEELGIGRPSTYAPIIETIQKRGYVTLENRRFVPTPLGKVVVDFLKEHFPSIIDVEFTAKMEEQLDLIEEGEAQWVQVLREFFEPFEQRVEQVQEKARHVKVPDEPSDQICDLCGRPMVIKWGRYGRFLACSGFPECRNTKPLNDPIGVACPECGGELVAIRSRRGRLFYGCSNYPTCGFRSWNRPVDRRCPQCGGILTLRRARRGGENQLVCINNRGPARTSPGSGGRDGSGEAPEAGAPEALREQPVCGYAVPIGAEEAELLLGRSGADGHAAAPEPVPVGANGAVGAANGAPRTRRAGSTRARTRAGRGSRASNGTARASGGTAPTKGATAQTRRSAARSTSGTGQTRNGTARAKGGAAEGQPLKTGRRSSTRG